MSNALSPMRFRGVIVALAGWACAPEQSPTEPAAAPDLAAVAATYTIRDLGTLGGPGSKATAINNAGVIVGSSSLVGGGGHAFVWKQGVMTDLGALGGGASHATAINQDGVIVGWSRVKSGDMRAVRWKNGVKKNLGTLGGRNSEALAINVFGVIVGWSETATGAQHAFVWKDGVMTDIGTLGGATSQANGINRAGTVVGTSRTASGEVHAFRWKDGVFKDLGTNGHSGSFANAINTKGQIVGGLGAPPEAVGEEQDYRSPFLYQSEVMTTFSTPGGPTATAVAISPTGIVVGNAEEVRAVEEYELLQVAWVRENGTAQGLPELAGGIAFARGINAAGHIVGYSRTASGQNHAVLWQRR